MQIKLGQKIIDKIRNKKNKSVDKVYNSKSYSQCGEDLIINFIFNVFLGQNSINYLDIGAHHSSWLSNTKFFYDKNCKGVLVEPDPELFKEIYKNRKNDICLNCGISSNSSKEADFYVMNVPTLNTFSREDALMLEKENGYKISKVIKVDLIDINDIIKQYFSEGLDFLSVDVEGLDFDIMKRIDFNNIRPKVICVESLTFNNDRKKQHKEEGIITFLKQKNYFVYADTFINTIFVDKTVWDS